MLIFIYNADSGFLSMLKDGSYKTVSPATYPCRLCDLSWGLLGERRRWRAFIDGLPESVRFLHRDEFEDEYPGVRSTPPNAYRLIDGRLTEVIGREVMENFSDLDQLEDAVRALMGEGG